MNMNKRGRLGHDDHAYVLCRTLVGLMHAVFLALKP